jgi:hypothetical protein
MTELMKTSILISVMSILICLFIEHTNRRVHDLLNEIEHRGNHFIDETEKRMRQLI